MWDYTDKVMDHFKNPRNVGVVEDPDGVGEVGSLACGDALKLTFKLDDDKRIADAKFQTFGCASAIASSSALTEMIKGMTIDEASEVTNQDIAEFLGGLPEQKMHCSVLGREALEVAIENYHTGKTSKKILEGKVICKCFGITEDEIEHVVRDNKLTTAEQVTNYCKAGGGCGGCVPEIEEIIERIQEELRAAAAPVPAKPRTILETIRLIEETMEREIRPMLQSDGGDIDLIDVDHDRVIIAFRGMCAQCNVAEFTMRDVVQAKLREFVSPDITVEEAKA
ncbi:MAG: Fe-S cluster assembly protein NifU [Kiritimatiellia bacterium]|jgi:NifU-like protein|nr:Fe-S cluster assembly protein NifU [Kiritimatiellia bacterium]MDP6630781.1 Fe-S cluster assembly protein NifU [Kiritimatiellia bacterium]MDP6809355.1 Fe-S cluster assembly protein NifU [Kiritimatiellia bacterium]MDP7023967.1 Fe-S cluster assembly protein NifU [Kiritimatiellia bacterium]